MKFQYKLIILFLIALIFNACATYDAQYVNDEVKQNQFPNKEIDKTFYLVGDAGLSPQNGLSDGLKAFQDYISDKKTKGE